MFKFKKRCAICGSKMKPDEEHILELETMEGISALTMCTGCADTMTAMAEAGLKKETPDDECL